MGESLKSHSGHRADQGEGTAHGGRDERAALHTLKPHIVHEAQKGHASVTPI